MRQYLRIFYNSPFLLILSLIIIIACQENKEVIDDNKDEKIEDNQELVEIYKNDQLERQNENIDWKLVNTNDSLRRVRVKELLDSNLVKTSNDYRNAAMVFQHGNDSIDYGMAVKLMQKSVDLDTTASKWLLAAATDRYLQSKGEPQIYGTQYSKKGMDEPWTMGDYDSLKLSDAERMKYDVPSLAEQRERLKQMNRKQLMDLYRNGADIDELFRVIKELDESNPEYDISENALNSLGYSLMAEGKMTEAIRIFELNIERHPNAYNPYDSYGEALLKLEDTVNSIKAYKKSLELNPNNTNAQNVIDAMAKINQH